MGPRGPRASREDGSVAHGRGPRRTCASCDAYDGLSPSSLMPSALLPRAAPTGATPLLLRSVSSSSSDSHGGRNLVDPARCAVPHAAQDRILCWAGHQR